MEFKELKCFLEEKCSQYNKPSFIKSDPISVPHTFSKKEDIEIAAFITASIAWGQRKTIIKNARRFMDYMDNSPFEFIINFKERDLKRFDNFSHRTFNGEDCAFFLKALKNIYLNYGGLEGVFSVSASSDEKYSWDALMNFRRIFFSLPHSVRTQKHVSNPQKGSAAKRLNMFLRWMVRKDALGVDFGIWKNFPQSELLCPLDVHSGNTARKLGVLKRRQNDRRAVEELTENLKKLDPHDPVKYDFALFGLGVFERF